MAVMTTKAMMMATAYASQSCYHLRLSGLYKDDDVGDDETRGVMILAASILLFLKVENEVGDVD